MINLILSKINREIHRLVKRFHFPKIVSVLLTLILIIHFIGGVLLFIPSLQEVQAAPGWLGNWQHRREITIDHTKIDSDITGLPIVLKGGISVGQNNADVSSIFDEVGDNWQKIAVTKSDGTTQLYVEKEKWDPINKEFILHVSKSDWVISSSTDTKLYIYYDNSQPDNTTYVGDIGSRPEVYNSNYKGVWHLAEDPSDTASKIKDSTANNNDGTSYGFMDSDDLVLGKVNGALDFDGLDDYIDITHDSLLSLPTTFNFTVLFWFNANGNAVSKAALTFQGTDDLSFYPNDNYLGSGGTRIFWRNLGKNIIDEAGSDLSNQWHQFAFVSRASNNHQTYRDGVLVGTSSASAAAGPFSKVYIGAFEPLDQNFPGKIDEVMILDTALSESEIKALYYSQIDSLVSWGEEEYNNYFKVTGAGTMTAGESNELTITAYDSSGNVLTSYTGNKLLTFSGPSSAPDGTTPTIEGVNIGSPVMVHFTNGVSDPGAVTLIAYKAETTTIDVTDGTIDSTGDPSYDLDLVVNPGSPDNLNFSQQPTNTSVKETILPPITVEIRDQYNNLCTNDNSTNVSIEINNNPGGGTLSGTTIKTASSGVAVFNDLSINRTGTGYTLDATSPGLTKATSDSFNIIAATHSWPFTTSSNYTFDSDKIEISLGQTMLKQISVPYDYIKISVDSTTHNDYGLSYPITYEFSIPPGSSNLKAYKRYTEDGNWTQITEKTSSDFFNGIEAVRFDYSNNRAYISVAFSSTSDEIHLKITDAWDQIVDVTYQGIPDYYDNRDAAVVATADDWDGDELNNTGFQNACDAFTSRNIWLTPGIITHGVRKYNHPAAIWSDIQPKIDAGYIEPASHSREHLGNIYSYYYTGTHTGSDNEQYTMTDSEASFPVDADGYTRNLVGWTIVNSTDGSSCTITSSNATSITCSAGLSGGTDNDWDNGDSYVIDRYDEEIGDSKTEIINNLDLPDLNKKNSSEYVYAWLRPYGHSDFTIQQKIKEYKYIVDRITDSDDDSFSDASFANGHYTVGGSLWLEDGDLTTANNKFDSVVNAGGIYHMMMHPKNIDWSTGWQLQHLDYIKGKTNIWYVGFGHLYLYHYIDDQNKVSVTKIGESTGPYYATDNPTIQPTVANSLNFTSLSTFTETATKNGGEIKYVLSNDSGATWLYYYDSGWTTSDGTYSQSNTAEEINDNISTFPTGDGNFLFKAFLHSDGFQLVQLDNIEVTYSVNTAPSATFDNDFSTWESGDVMVNYNLIDDESDTLNISQTVSSGIEYSTDGSTWYDTTDAGGASEGLTGLNSTSTPGTDHIFIWDSTADLPNIEDSTVYLRIRPNDGIVSADSWVTSTAFGIDNVAPSSVGAPSFGTITTSSIEIIKPSTVTENGSGLYQWQVRRNGTTELGFNEISITSIIDSSLAENTQYTYDVQFKDNVSNISNYGTSATRYTLVDTPSNLVASSVSTNSITLSVDSFPNDDSGSSGYYFENTTTGSNSGWIQTNSWQDTGLSCGTSYTYIVKYRNGDGVETNTISLVQSTNNCSGGRMPSVWYNPPTPPAPTAENPQGGFRIIINDGDKITNSRFVTLKLFAGSDTERMEISNNPDFTGIDSTGQIPYQPSYSWDICEGQEECPNGIYTIYAKFFTPWSKSSEVVSDSIILDVTSKKEKKEEIIPKPKEISEVSSRERPIIKPKLTGEFSVPEVSTSSVSSTLKEPSNPSTSGEIKANILTFTSTQGNIVIKSNTSQKFFKLVTGLKLKIVIKPLRPAQEVKVTIIFNKPRESSSINNDKFASPFITPVVHAQTRQVAEYTLTDKDGDGVFEGEIKMPEVAGEYTIKTTLYYKDGTIEDVETETVIDPKGYIYQSVNGKQLRIPNAKISLYVFNSKTNKFELWEAQKYDQENPQVTDKTGEYYFLVPEGKYYLTVTASGYQDYQSEEFEIKEGDIITSKIKLTPIKKFNWQWLIFLAILIAGIIIAIFIKRKNINKIC